MAEGENKKVANLSFDVDLTKLDEMNAKFKEIAQSSTTFANQISKNLNNALNIGQTLNPEGVNTKLQKISGYVTTAGTKMKYTLSSVDFSKMINTSQVAKQLSEGVSLSKTQLKSLSSYAIKNNVDTMNNIKEDNAKTSNNLQEIWAKDTSYHNRQLDLRETQEQKHADTMEEIYARQGQSVETLYDKIANYAQTYIIYNAFNQLKQAVSETIDEMVDMEEQMVAINRVLSDGFDDEGLDEYRDELIQIAYDYGNSFNDVADVALKYAQAGYDQEEILALTEKTMLALNTADLDATQATEDLIAVTAQWGLKTGDATKDAELYGEMIDKINKIADKYPTTSSDILDAMKKVSSAFNIAGASIDETIASIVSAETVSQKGGKAIGTALGNIIQQLKDDNRLTIAESLGLDFYTDETETEFKDIMDIFQEMADKMQALKDAGKENSTEMQELLSIFTVFRRNIGASLLGEMSDETGTYNQVLQDLNDTLGYSAEENQKYMATVAAAQNQLNDELLKLKTQVWDNGLEEVYRNLISGGTNLIKTIESILKKVGLIPTSIGLITAVITAMKSRLNVADIDKIRTSIEKVNTAIQASKSGITVSDKSLTGLSSSFKTYATSVGKGEVSMTGYTKSLVTNGLKTAWLTAKTIALNAAISLGLSLAITAITSLIYNYAHAEEKAAEASKEAKEAAEEAASTYEEEVSTYQDLIDRYKEAYEEYKTLQDAKADTSEAESTISDLQTEINEKLKESKKQVELIKETTSDTGENVKTVNENYQEQLDTLKQIAYEKKKAQISELRTAAEEAVKGQTGVELEKNGLNGNSIINALMYSGVPSQVNSQDFNASSSWATQSEWANETIKNFNKLDVSQQYETLKEWREELVEAQGSTTKYSTAISEIDSQMETLATQVNTAKEAVDAYTDALGELYDMSGQISDFNNTLNQIYSTYESEAPRTLINNLKSMNDAFSNGEMTAKEYFDGIQEAISSINLDKNGEDLEAYQAIFAATTSSLAEGLESLQSGLNAGEISFAEYAKEVKEVSDDTLELYTLNNNLTFNGNDWVDASGVIDDYANSLAYANGRLNEMQGLLTVIGDNYDYISEHANSSGEAMFNASNVGTEAYQNLATQMTQSLNALKDTNAQTFNAITQDVLNGIGATTNDMLDANGYINEGFFNNEQALNEALNSSANQTETAVSNVTTALGNVMKALGDAIENFDYTLSGDWVATNSATVNLGPLGTYTLPTKIGYKITGTGGSSIKDLGAALKDFGSQVGGLGTQTFSYTPRTLGNYTSSSGSSGSSSSGTSSGTSSSGSSGSGSSSSSSTTDDSQEKALEEAQDALEDAYDEQLDTFKNYIKEKERLEQRWVSKQKELGIISTSDYLQITEDRINRYKDYLQELSEATWMNEEDRKELEQDYYEEIEDLEVDYLGYLKDKLDEEIDALEDANDEKIALIKEEAQAKIDALDAVEDENDRLQKEQEYNEERQEILEEISYWEQRTGKEAQENLAEYKEKLADLDEEWSDQLHDWDVSDQIAKIEEERDAQIQAIEDTQEAQEKSMQETYDEVINLYKTTGTIIYENIDEQSQLMYDQYKSNFIDPILTDLKSINSTATSTINEAQRKVDEATQPAKVEEATTTQYETYTIKSGDTLSAIARAYNTTIDKILEANPYVTNKNLIYTGKTLQIPKFHEGGIVGGSGEGYALLKKNEVVLKPEWASSMNRLMKYFDTISSGNTGSVGASPTINVDGDLVKVEANIKDQNDIDFLSKKLERMLKDKFTINK